MKEEKKMQNKRKAFGYGCLEKTGEKKLKLMRFINIHEFIYSFNVRKRNVL